MQRSRVLVAHLSRFHSCQWVRGGEGGRQGLEKYYETLYHQQVQNFGKQAKRQKKQNEGPTSHRADHPHAGDVTLDISDNQELMQRSITHFEGELAKLQVGRATPTMMDHLKVSAYGNSAPFNQVAICTVRDSQTLAARPFDSSLQKELEKAISQSPLQFSVRVEGEEIIVSIPRPTTESIEAMVKVVHQEAEKARVTIRHQRKKARDVIKDLDSEDEKAAAEKEITKAHDQFIKQIDAIMKKKEADIRKG